MRLEDLRHEVREGRVRVSAEVMREDSGGSGSAETKSARNTG